MIYFFWPKKPVPAWLYEIKFSGKSNGVPKVYHKGFGFVVKKNNQYHVTVIHGCAVYIEGADMIVDIKGGGDGVFVRFWRF